MTLDRASFILVSALVITLVRCWILAGVAAAGLAAFRTRNTSVRLFIWKSVLYASVTLPLLGGLLPPVQFSVPQSLRDRIAAIPLSYVEERENIAIPESRSGAMNTAAMQTGSYGHAMSPSEQSKPKAQERSSESVSPASFVFSWSLVAAASYLVVALLLFARFTAGLLFTSKLVKKSRAITESAALAKLASAVGHLPNVAASECISVPITVGIFRPTILLPSAWRAWDTAKLSAVLGHELSHVARRDALTQCVSLFYRAIFWCNPLSWWLHRHLCELSEQASDEAALSAGADQRHYAQTLLDFFDALHKSPGRIRWQGVSMARTGQPEQRLERILAWKGTVAMNVKKSLTAAIVLIAIPVVYLAASVRPASGTPVAVLRQSPVPAAPAAPPVAGISAAPQIVGAPSVAPVPPTPAIAPVAPVAPVTMMAPTAWPEGRRHSSGSDDGNRFFYAYGDDDEERFVIASGKSDSYTMSGSTQDIRHVEKLKKQIAGDFIWFQRDEKSYIIRDQATINRARGFWAGQEELGRKQEELGKKQEELGEQQEELGKKMEQVKVNVPEMTADLDRLKAKLQKLGSTATMEQMGELQSEIGELQSKIGDIQGRAGEEQGKIGELQGELGEKQGKLGEQQGELGRQQGELAERATQQMKGLLDEAIKNGTAKPEDEAVKNPTL